jgi:uncharacterized membrane protein
VVTDAVISYIFPMLSKEIVSWIGVAANIVFIVIGVSLIRSAMKDEQKWSNK